jgi:hypothetical protein
MQMSGFQLVVQAQERRWAAAAPNSAHLPHRRVMWAQHQPRDGVEFVGRLMPLSLAVKTVRRACRYCAPRRLSEAFANFGDEGQSTMSKIRPMICFVSALAGIALGVSVATAADISAPAPMYSKAPQASTYD